MTKLAAGRNGSSPSINVCRPRPKQPSIPPRATICEPSRSAGTDEAKAVMAKMREMPINDFFAKNGKLREDGRMVHDMYLVEVKRPAGPWDHYKIKATIPGDQAFRPAGEDGCPLVNR